MNRSARESLVGARTVKPALSQHRRGHSLTLNGGHKDSSAAASAIADENNLDLFSKSRRSLSVTSSDESSDVSVKLGRLSVGLTKVSRSGIDDLLSSTDGGKHDYDWLLTPPGTPTMFPSSEVNEPRRTLAAPRSSPLARSASTTKASRLSVSQSETNHSSRPTRSSSVTRSSTSTSLYNTYSSNRSSNILNTSSASVSSYTRPASPITRSSSTARSSTPSSRPTLSRPSTPSRARLSLSPSPTPTSSSVDRSRPGQSSRPSTPSSRPQIPANLSSPAARSNSRPSTPTRRSPVSSISPAASPSISNGRVLSNGRNPTSTSRPSSPSPRVRPPPQPVVPPDFPLDTPPNLRTTLPDRPLSAGRTRPGASLTTKGNPETTTTITSRRHSSPIVTRGRLMEPAGRSRPHGNGHLTDAESRRASHAPDLTTRKPVKASTTSVDNGGFGRSISKKSLDMAIRHMDIKSGGGNIRPLSGTTLFPQSIRSATSKPQAVRTSSAPSSVVNGGLQTSYNGLVSENGNYIDRPAEKGTETNGGRRSAKLSEVDIYESSRYDAILLKEDLKNTNWLHSIDDKTDQGPIFDNGFEPLPEPFGLL